MHHNIVVGTSSVPAATICSWLEFMVRFNKRLRDLSQALIQNSHIANSDVSTIDEVCFTRGEKSILGTGENASRGSPDARTALFGPGGSENIIQNIEVHGLSSIGHKTRRMAQDELAALDQNSRLAMFHQNL